MYKMSSKLVDKQVDIKQNDWRETKKHRSDEFELKATMNQQKKRGPSPEQVAFMSGELEDADDSFTVEFTPGTFVESRRYVYCISANVTDLTNFSY